MCSVSVQFTCPDRRLATCFYGRKCVGRIHVAFGELAGCVTRMLTRASNDFAAHMSRFAIRHSPQSTAGDGTHGTRIACPTHERRGNPCFCSVWRPVSFKSKRRCDARNQCLLDVFENRGCFFVTASAPRRSYTEYVYSSYVLLAFHNDTLRQTMETVRFSMVLFVLLHAQRVGRGMSPAAVCSHRWGIRFAPTGGA